VQRLKKCVIESEEKKTSESIKNILTVIDELARLLAIFSERFILNILLCKGGVSFICYIDLGLTFAFPADEKWSVLYANSCRSNENNLLGVWLEQSYATK
jgi:hypothetical protein